jgi:hypothetical protein
VSGSGTCAAIGRADQRPTRCAGSSAAGSSPKTRATKALAESFLSELRQAAKRGEAFDISEGLPVSMRRAKHARSWFAFVLAYVDMKWPRAAATTRNSMTDALATVTAALVDDRPGRPEVALLRRALRQYALVPSSRMLPRPAEVAAALGWLDRASLSLSELEKPRNVRLALDALTLRLDGTSAAASGPSSITCWATRPNWRSFRQIRSTG